MDAEAFGAHDRFEIVDRREMTATFRGRLFVDDDVIEAADRFELFVSDGEPGRDLVARLRLSRREAQA